MAPNVYRSNVRDRNHYNIGSPFAEIKQHGTIVTTTGSGGNDIHSGREKLCMPPSIEANEEQISRMTKKLKETFPAQGQYSMSCEKMKIPKLSKDTKGEIDVSDEKIESNWSKGDQFGSSAS